MTDILTPALVAAFVSFVTALVTLRTSERQIQIENITQERAKWREKIRKQATEVQRACRTGEVCKLNALRLDFALALNPFCAEDQKILCVIEKIAKSKNEDNEQDAKLREFSDRLSLLLKHDWERAKLEAKPWTSRVFSVAPTRVRYFDFKCRPRGRIGVRSCWNRLMILHDGNGLLFAIAAACALFLFVPNHRHWLPAYPVAVKLAVWAGLLFFGCLWIVRLIDALRLCFVSRPEKPSSCCSNTNPHWKA